MTRNLWLACHPVLSTWSHTQLRINIAQYRIGNIVTQLKQYCSGESLIVTSLFAGSQLVRLKLRHLIPDNLSIPELGKPGILSLLSSRIT